MINKMNPFHKYLKKSIVQIFCQKFASVQQWVLALKVDSPDFACKAAATAEAGPPM